MSEVTTVEAVNMEELLEIMDSNDELIKDCFNDFMHESPDVSEDEISLEETFGPEIINLWRSHGLQWGESDLKRFLQELAKKKEEEATILNLLLS